MNFEDMPNSAYAAYLQSKKAEEERKSNDQYKNSIVNATNAVEEQSILLQRQLQEMQEQNQLLCKQIEQAQDDAANSKTEARKNKIFGWVSFGIGTVVTIVGIVLGIIL